ncbi:hypothetical protein GOHSU_08_00150 [Gordonia hirsuta DSM 44140 = NBRC 16056]|uniref:DUF4440 domain-containing protein n=1 Tax=Gordonia hirsuta DSM 44140 = NBRC 16056 TaxID=1121927 RepID=L7L8Y1_9ACTN|nr:hypothetical protein [Gordonia hirsuta]GAC56487.1 hypothetical protein GOHSU_08_00150 [Gordonia hirsuta DSM 44140 = NBRC 16056]
MVPADRRLLTGCAVVAVLAILAAVVAAMVWWRADSGVGSESDRVTVEQAAAAAVGELMTFAPGDDQAGRAAVAQRLAGALAADYLSRGPDVVFPGATASKITMTGTVIDAGVSELAAHRARVLVFVDQSVGLAADTGEPERLALARWATMVRDGDRWLLARLEPVAQR